MELVVGVLRHSSSTDRLTGVSVFSRVVIKLIIVVLPSDAGIVPPEVVCRILITRVITVAKSCGDVCCVCVCVCDMSDLL